MTYRFRAAGLSAALVVACLGCGQKPAEAPRPEPQPADQPVPGASPAPESAPKSAPQPASAPDAERIQGTWRFESAVRDGNPVEKAELARSAVVFNGSKMTIRDGKGDESELFKLDPTARPAAIDLTDPDGPGETVPGIYDLDGDRLRVCVADGRKAARPTAFESAPGSGRLLWVLTRDRDAPPLVPEKKPDATAFPKAIVGKWKFSSGETAFGLLVWDTEFTADGRVLQKGAGADREAWDERYTYRFEGETLVLTSKGDGARESRFRIVGITADELNSARPKGVLRRLK